MSAPSYQQNLLSHPFPLQEQLDRKRQEILASMPAEVAQAILDAIRQLGQSGIVSAALCEGDQAPDFSLPNIRGTSIRLSQAWSGGAVVLSFYRGGWCPYCNLELRALQHVLPEIKRLGATLIAVSPQTSDHSLDTAQNNILEYDVLSDVGNHVARRFGLVHILPEELKPIYRKWGIDLPNWNGDYTYTLPLPATYVIDSKGVIRFAYVDNDYTRRLEPEVILSVLHEMRKASDPFGSDFRENILPL